MNPARSAISLLFLAHGLIAGSWVPRIPEVLEKLGIDAGGMGALILLFGLGSLLAMPIVGVVVSRLGSRALCIALTILAAPTLLLISLAPGLFGVAFMLFFTGMVLGGLDVAMNANGVAVEGALGRPIMSSLHGCWSVGGLIGSGLGGPLLAGIGSLPHAGLVALVVVLLTLVASRTVAREAASSKTTSFALRLPKRGDIYAVGLIAFLGMVPEGAIMDWSALYLRRELGSDIAASGLPFAVFSVTMAINRFLGDAIRARLGARRTLQLSCLFAAIGFLMLGTGDVALVLAGCAIAGIGTANIVPIAFAAGGSVPGLAAAQGISIVTTIGYSGILLAPSAIGWIAERTGFAAVFGGLFLMPLMILGLSRFVAPVAEHAVLQPRVQER